MKNIRWEDGAPGGYLEERLSLSSAWSPSIQASLTWSPSIQTSSTGSPSTSMQKPSSIPRICLRLRCLRPVLDDEPHICKLHIPLFKEGKREEHVCNDCFEGCAVKYRDMEGGIKDRVILNIEGDKVKDESGREVGRVRNQNQLMLGRKEHDLRLVIIQPVTKSIKDPEKKK